MTNARIFGLLSGTEDAPRVAYLKPGVHVPPGILRQLGQIAPTQVFRFAAACEEQRCTHFDGSRCRLGERIFTMLKPVVDSLPPCQIRSHCRWYAEQGHEICLRCPQIITLVPKDSDELSGVASGNSEREAAQSAEAGADPASRT